MGDRASFASYATSGITTLFGAMTAQEWGVVFGVVLGVLTLAVNWYYKREHLKLEQAKLEHSRREREHE